MIPTSRLPKARRLAPTAALAALLATPLAALLATPLGAQYDPTLQYQNRGDRHEGLRPKPVSGYDVALLSARVDYREEREGWPEEMRLKFYLPRPEEVFITVRQLRPRSTFYWLDKVAAPKDSWRPGMLNDYAWPTATVLQKLTRVTADDLGAVVRLQQELPGQRERVAPAILYGSGAPSEAPGYRFTLKTNGTAQVTCKIYRDTAELFTRPKKRERAGSPFTVRWDSGGQPDGDYRLVVSGYFESDSSPISKEIAFYHRTRLTP